MPRELWAKVAVEVIRDQKLIGRPVADRWLWLGLICLAKEMSPEDGVVRGYDAATLGSVLNLGVTAAKVTAALQHFEQAGMVVLREGEIELVNFSKRQAVSKDNPEAAAKRQREKRARDKELNHGCVTGDVTGRNTRDGSVMRHADQDQEKDQEKKELRSAPAPRPLVPSTQDLEAEWTPAALVRVREALTATRKSGTMAEGPWRAFLLKARQFGKNRREAAVEAFLDRGYHLDGKREAYLVGMMRGGAGVEPAQASFRARPTPQAVNDGIPTAAESAARIRRQEEELTAARAKETPESKAKIQELIAQTARSLGVRT